MAVLYYVVYCAVLAICLDYQCTRERNFMISPRFDHGVYSCQLLISTAEPEQEAVVSAKVFMIISLRDHYFFCFSCVTFVFIHVSLKGANKFDYYGFEY